MADASSPPPSSKRLRQDAQEDDCCRAPQAVADASPAPPQSSKRLRHDAQVVDCLPLQRQCGVPVSPAVSSHISFLESLCELESAPQDEADSLPFSSESTCSQELLLAEMMLSLEKVIGDGGADAKNFANEQLQRPTDYSSGLPSNGEDSEVQARIRHLLEASDDELGLQGSSFSGDVVRQVSDGEPVALRSSSTQTSGGEEDWSALDDDEVQVYNVGAWWLDEAFEHGQNSEAVASGCLVMVDL